MEFDMNIYRRGFNPQLIKWSEFYRNLLISRTESDILEELKLSNEFRKRVLLENINTSKICASAFVNILSYPKIPQIGNALVALEELLEVYPPLANYLDVEARSQNKTLYELLLSLLHHEDELLMYLDGYIISKVIRKGKCRLRKNDLIYFLTWIKSEQRFCSPLHLTMLMRILKTTLHVDASRLVLYELEGIPDLISFLHEYDDFQIHYDVIFCIWLITFNKNLAERIDNYDIIGILVNILDSTAKVKVMRMILATFTNLVKMSTEKRSAKHCLSMLKRNVLKRIKTLNYLKLQDEEMLSDMAYIKENVEKATRALSSFEEFTYEVTSGNLRWGPVHTSPEFWQENANKLNDNNYELLIGLLKWLDKSEDEEVISVACFDVGQYLQYYPQGKEAIDVLGGKRTLLDLITSDYSSVQYEALHTAQKLLLNNWDNLGTFLQEKLGTPAHRTPT